MKGLWSSSLIWMPALTLLSGCPRNPATTPLSSAVQASPGVIHAETRAPVSGLYTEVSETAGLKFRFTNGATGRHYLIETTGSGCAFFDYNRDGWPDILLLQAGELPVSRRAPSRSPQNRLYRNNGDGSFTDITAGSGLEDTGYSQAVAIGDVNGDGFDDLFITAYGENHLFLNRGGSGKFEDITARSGLADTKQGPRWSSSAAFGDYNNDGKLDLYLCRYAIWSFQTDKPCKNPRGESSYCSPELYEPEVHALFRGNGDGTFTDVSAAAGITKAKGHGLAVAWLDYNGDGWEDIFVANDLSPYMLWRNNGDGTFTEVGMRSNVALSELGTLLSGMGIGIRDYNGDGLEDIFVTNFSGQMNALYRNEPTGLFTNTTTASGIGPASMKHLAFGCEFIDFNRDGWPDLIIGNGHVNDDVEAYSQGDSYKQPKSLLQNNGDGTFTALKENLGDLARAHVTRGLAVADFDLDGHLDVLANNQDGPPQLLRYSGPATGHWFALDLRGVRSNPNGYHAKVTLRVGNRQLFAEARSGSSYASHSHGRLYFGLGEATVIDQVTILWHGSRTQTVARNVAADSAYLAVEGKPLQPVAKPQPVRRAP
jgi:hypothetical protein